MTGPMTKPETPNTARPTQGRQQHEVVGHLGVAPDQDRAQQIVHQTDEENASSDQDDPLHDLSPSRGG